jgi:methyl-accepting chemotaxis protein
VSLTNLAISRRLALGFFAVLLTTVVLTVIAVVRVEAIQDRLATINDENAVKQRYAINFRGSVHDRAISLRDVVMLATPAAAQPEIDTIKTLAAKYSDSATKLDAIFGTPGKVSSNETAALTEIKRIETETLPLIQKVIDLRMAGDVDQALQVLMQQAKPLFIKWLAAINLLIDLEESMNQVESAAARNIANGFLTVMGLLLALAIVLASVVAWWITRSITRPLADAERAMAAVAAGDLTQRLDARSNNELGRMAGSVNSALARMGEAMAGVAGSTGRLSSTSQRIGSLSHAIAGGAAESSNQADVVASAASEVSRNIQTVAAGSEEMGVSIREIAHNAQEAASIAGRAVTAVEATTATVSRLGESSRMIGDVVRVITSIAEQTNLLALNATIEAARAGDTGKGFAVVAGEVKDLAQETARATEDISRRVDAIQADTTSAVAAIADVTQVITQINDYQTTIASAVEEQTATTNEMNRSVSEAAAGSNQIAANINGVATTAKTTTASVTESRHAADELAQISDQLQGLVSNFRY